MEEMANKEFQEMEEIMNKVLPCMQEYYKGKSNWKKNKCLEKKPKCEYLNGMYNFINKCYPGYKVTECCDKDSSKPFPEAILTNFETNKTIAIEMKCFPYNVYSSVKKTDDENGKENFFWKQIIDRCILEAENRAKGILKEKIIEGDPEYVSQLFETVFCRMNVRLISKSNKSVQEIMMKKDKNNKQMEFFIASIVDYTEEFFNMLFYKKKFFLKYRYENDELEVIICFGENKSFRIEILDKNVKTLGDIFKVDQNGILDFLKKFIKGCENKFANVEVDKRILLLDSFFEWSETEDTIKACLESIPVSPVIDEIWLTEKELVEKFDDEGDLKEKFVMKYEKIHEQAAQKSV